MFSILCSFTLRESEREIALFFFLSVPILNVKIKMDSLWINLEAMSLSTTHKGP